MPIQDLYDALKEEFDTDVTFYPTIPAVVSPPAIVIMPSDPFLEVATHGAIRETWDVLVAVSIKDTESAVILARDLSLRINRAAGTVGAVWGGAAGLTVPESLQLQHAVAVNTVHFKYVPEL